MVEIARILCPVDLSDHSRHALDTAVAFARWYDAHVSVMYVRAIATPMLAPGPYAGLEAFPPLSWTEEERLEAQQAVDAFVAADRAAGARIDTVLREEVNVAGAIAGQAGMQGTDLVVMGTHGRSGFERLLLGSVTEKVIRIAACPVLTVPPHASDSVPRTASALDRILCAVDFSETSARVLSFASSLAATCGATLTVLHVLELLPEVTEMPSFDMSGYRATRFEEAGTHLAALLTPEVRHACKTQELLIAGKPGREILRVAADQQAGLVVVGSRGRGALDRLVFGSTAAHVVRHAVCPVMTIR